MKHMAIGTVLGLALGYLSLQVLDYATTPDPSKYFEVNDIFVPDHFVGQDPIIIYDRNIKKPFVARWTVEFQKVQGSKFVTVCNTKEHRSNYDPEDYLPDKGVTLYDWYTEGDCTQKVKVSGPGEYRIDTVWVLQLEDGKKPQVEKKSNIFKIIGKE